MSKLREGVDMSDIFDVIVDLTSQIGAKDKRIAELEAQVEKMRKALDKIAKLFGENDRRPDDYGKIAREALKDAK